MQLLINVLFFKVGWVSSVVGGANQMPWLGPLAVLVAVAAHLWIAHRPAKELLLLIACGSLGAVFDSVLVSMNWVTYASGIFSDGVAPYWIITMWVLLGTTLNVSMRWLRGKPLLAFAVGAVSGPLAYLAGAKLGGILFIDKSAALISLSIGWAVVLPILMTLAERFDGITPRRPAAMAQGSS